MTNIYNYELKIYGCASGSTVQAIKSIRALTGWSVADSKYVIDHSETIHFSSKEVYADIAKGYLYSPVEEYYGPIVGKLRLLSIEEDPEPESPIVVPTRKDESDAGDVFDVMRQIHNLVQPLSLKDRGMILRLLGPLLDVS